MEQLEMELGVLTVEQQKTVDEFMAIAKHHLQSNIQSTNRIRKAYFI